MVVITFHRLRLMVLAFFAPEIVTAWAAWQLLCARQATKDFIDAGFGAQHAKPHSDGRVRWRKLVDVLFSFMLNSSRSSGDGWTLTHGFFAGMGGFVLCVDGEPRATLTPDELVRFVGEGTVDEPVITEAEIKDRSKGDALSKCVAILQLVWFVIQLIARYAQNLPVTLLEIDTLGVTIMACISYGLWLYKPKDIECPYVVRWNAHVPPPPPGSLTNDKGRIPAYVLLSQLFNSKIRWSRRLTRGMIVFIIEGFSGMVFGGIHCLGWNSLFPRHVEQTLWRVASIGATVGMLAVFLICFGLAALLDLVFRLSESDGTSESGGISGIRECKNAHWRKIVVFLGITNIYCWARLALIVLMMLNLRSLPPGAYYTVAWNKFIPHANL
jgi:hypothetical protein